MIVENVCVKIGAVGLVSRLHAPMLRSVSLQRGAHITGHVSARKPTTAAAAEAETKKNATAKKGGIGWDDTTEPRRARCGDHTPKQADFYSPPTTNQS